jgi:IS5 family transposase
MRKTVADQLPLVPLSIDHRHARELDAMNAVLEQVPHAVEAVHEDLVRGLSHPDKGRLGISAEQALRALILKQMADLSYERLAFHLADSTSYRTFCRYGVIDKTPSASALQRALKKIRAETLESINAMLVGYANAQQIEDGSRVRTDCTVEQSNIHAPYDSSLLHDCTRVLTRLMAQAKRYADVRFSDHRRRVKRRSVEILHAKKKERRVALYRDLLKATRQTVSYVEPIVSSLEDYRGDVSQTAEAQNLATKLRHYAGLSLRVIDQAERRVLNGESVPSDEKIVSIFEEHTDIIVKDRRETHYGHKLCLTTGRSGLVVDCMVLDGNPADCTLAVRAIERVQQSHQLYPEQASFDGGFASKDNVAAIKALGVKDVAFSKKRGLAVSEMVRESWIYRCLRNFRAGIESMISFLKRCFGLTRCTWRGMPSFRAYTWGSIVSANLLLLARHTLG